MSVDDLVQNYINYIKNDFDISKIIIAKVGKTNQQIVENVNNSTIISICIKYETFTADLIKIISKRTISYNRPWVYTRLAFKKLRILNYEKIYEQARDVWGYYNDLKHVNGESKLEIEKLWEKYNLKNSWDALKFTYHTIENLLFLFFQKSN